MKAIAIDDEHLALEVIKAHAEKVSFIDLKAVFTNPFLALEYLQHEKVDLIFLDIKMPDISGIDFYKGLVKKPLLVFTTAYSDHAATSFDLDAVDYLLKPFSLSRFIKACNKVNELFGLRNTTAIDHIFVKTGHDQVKILFQDIIYIEATGNYVSYVLSNKTILAKSTFSEAEILLPSDKFIRIHRSYIVAIDNIQKIEKQQIVLNGNHTLPISESYIENIGALLAR